MDKNINYLGIVNLPWQKFFKLLKDNSTKVEFNFDPGIILHRTKAQTNLQKKILKMYPKKSQKFYRYTNKNFSNLIPNKIWKKFKIQKEDAKILILRHTPGTFTAPHFDTYYNFLKSKNKKNAKNTRKNVVRIWVSMTDPKLGHALFVGNNVAYNLKKGTALTFKHNVYHSACNAGWEDRYILTITSWKNG